MIQKFVNETTSQSPLYYRILGSRVLTGSRLGSVRKDLSSIYQKILVEVDSNDEHELGEQAVDTSYSVVSFSSNVYDFDCHNQKGFINVTIKFNLNDSI